MKRIALLLLLTGCARFNTLQESSTSTSGVTTRRTEVHGSALFSSVQSFAQPKLTQSDKTQTVGASSIGQQGATNTVELIKAVTELLKTLGVGAASGGTVP